MSIKQTLLIYVFLVTGILSIHSQQVQNADSAFVLSERLNKPVFIIFSGSDWCPACIRFQKKVLSDNNFKNFANTNLVLLIVDFPQKKLLDRSLALQNEKLAEQYNKNSTFPKLLLLCPGNKSLTEIPYVNQDAGAFIAVVKELLPEYNK